MNASTAPARAGIYGAPRGLRRVVLTWARRPAADAAAALLLVPWLLLPTVADGRALFTDLDPEARRAVYQTLTALAATLAGFVLTSVSILINLLRTPLSLLDDMVGPQDKARVGGAFLVALRPLAVAFVASFAGFLTDSENAVGNPVTQALVLGCLLASASGIGRIVWVMRRLIAVTNAGAG